MRCALLPMCFVSSKLCQIHVMDSLVQKHFFFRGSQIDDAVRPSVHLNSFDSQVLGASCLFFLLPQPHHQLAQHDHWHQARAADSLARWTVGSYVGRRMLGALLLHIAQLLMGPGLICKWYLQTSETFQDIEVSRVTCMPCAFCTQ